MKEWVYILAIWNVVTFILMAIDKYKAVRGKWRISESALLTAAFAMGGFGSLLGSLVFHHKTRKWKFRILLPVALLFNISLLFLIWYYVI
jgi:uncharacterized membrane protein YsdA (DUF1294 family)